MLIFLRLKYSLIKDEVQKDIFSFDNEIRKKNFIEYICGVDEVGRGCIAGPIVACAIILPKDLTIPNLRESKSVSPKYREILFKEILENCLDVSCSFFSTNNINKYGLGLANQEVLKDAVLKIKHKFDLVLVDGYKIKNLKFKQIDIIKGDTKSASIAAASIVAKVLRDRTMKFYSKFIPCFGFDRHKGYSTRQHTDTIRNVGLCEIHRSYAYKFVKGRCKVKH